MPAPTHSPVLVFDLDGTLLDSDAALVAPFVQLGMREEEITFGHPVEEACREWGIDLDEYVRRYDTAAARPFPGAEELVGRLDRWAICSNKHPVSGRAELERLGWAPEVAAFADTFDYAPKRLEPVLDRLGVMADDVVFVGDTGHDRACAEAVGCRFVWAGWNPRTMSTHPDGEVAATPSALLGLLDGRGLLGA